MIYHDMTFKLTRITGTIIAVAQVVCVKPLGERFPINPQASKKRIMTENFKSLVVRLVSVYRFQKLTSFHFRAFVRFIGTVIIRPRFLIKNEAFFRKIDIPQIRGKLICVIGMGVVEFVEGDFSVSNSAIPTFTPKSSSAQQYSK